VDDGGVGWLAARTRDGPVAHPDDASERGKSLFDPRLVALKSTNIIPLWGGRPCRTPGPAPRKTIKTDDEGVVRGPVGEFFNELATQAISFLYPRRNESGGGRAACGEESGFGVVLPRAGGW
jgi:hypothetical protein